MDERKAARQKRIHREAATEQAGTQDAEAYRVSLFEAQKAAWHHAPSDRHAGSEPGGHAYTFHVSGGWPWSGGQGNEKWCLTDATSGGYTLRPWNARHLCLDVPAGRYKEGQGLIVWDCNGGKNQIFFVKAHENYFLIGPAESGGLFMHRGAHAEGSQVSLWKHQNINARWQ